MIISPLEVLRFDIITIFPDFFRAAFEYGIIRRASSAGLVEVRAHDLRAWAGNKHRIVDDRPFGGGDGMVLKPEPIFAAVEQLTGATGRESYPQGTRVVLLSPQGRVLNQQLAAEIAQSAFQAVLICGRYEGVDERVTKALVTDEVSIGDFVLSGGEPAAIVLVDAVTRLVPGALGNEGSAAHDSFSEGLLEHPHYTRPPEFRGMKVPNVLLSGNHGEIARWRREHSLRKTRKNRPDLLALRTAEVSEEERAWLEHDAERESEDR